MKWQFSLIVGVGLRVGVEIEISGCAENNRNVIKTPLTIPPFLLMELINAGRQKPLQPVTVQMRNSNQSFGASLHKCSHPE